MNQSDEFTPRCPDCAFLNPAGSVFCGMCGSELPDSPLKFVTQNKKELHRHSYENVILKDDFGRVDGFAYQRWQTQMWQSVAGTFVLFCFALGISATINELTSGFGKIFLTFIMIVPVSALILGTIVKSFLDLMRGTPPRIFNSVEQAFRKFLPLSMAMIVHGILYTLIGLCYLLMSAPGRYILENSDIFEEGSVSYILGIFWIFSSVIILLPVPLLIISWLFLAVSRIMDYRKGEWAASWWAIIKSKEKLGGLLVMGLMAVLNQVYGLVMCWVGLLGTLPLSAARYVAMYEWIRLNTKNPDAY